MINTLEDINLNLEDFDSLAPYPLKPFWPVIDIVDDDPYWGVGSHSLSNKKALLISGPSRSGNHLIHSIMDDHPQLARLPGEDSFLAAFFNDLVHEGDKVLDYLRSKENVDYILNLSGYGCNKWKLLSEMAHGDPQQQTDVWSGIHPEGGYFATDYQDTIVRVNYPAYEARLRELADEIRKAPTFIDVFWMYLDALERLDPEGRGNKVSYIYVGSGMRGELDFIFARTAQIKCVTPVRPFESYYFSFVKGRLGSVEIEAEFIQEAWENWWHKVVDYLLLKKKYPHMICIVNFVHVLEDPEKTIRELCRFSNIKFNVSCLSLTSMGYPTKGNSSFPKGEEYRGKIYQSSKERQLPMEYWPELYSTLWNMVAKLSI